MASQEEAIYVELPVSCIVSPKHSIGPKEKEKIYSYVIDNLHRFREYLETAENVNVLCIKKLERFPKEDCLSMEFKLTCEHDLSVLYDATKKPQKDPQNELSYQLTHFFKSDDLPLECGLKRGSTVSFNITMDENKQQSVQRKFEQQRKTDQSSGWVSEFGTFISEKEENGKTMNDQQAGTVQTLIQRFDHDGNRASSFEQVDTDSQVRMTFIVDADQKNLVSVKIVSDEVKELNREIPLRRTNIYSIDIQVPGDYNPYAGYSYELKFKEYIFIFFKTMKEFKTERFLLGDKTVHRDLIWGDSVFAHFDDIIRYAGSDFSENDLVKQIEDLAECIHMTQKEGAVMYLLQRGIPYVDKALVRFCVIIGVCFKGYPYKVATLLESNITTCENMLKALLKKSITDFPLSASDYLPTLCVYLLERVYKKRFCALLCIEKVKTFLQQKDVVEILHALMTKKTDIVCRSELCRAGVKDVFMYYFDSYAIQKSADCLKICEILLRHIPLYLALDIFEKLTSASTNQFTEDANVASLHDCLVSQVLASTNKAVKERKPREAFEIAVRIGKLLVENKNHRKILENNLVKCLTFQLPESINPKQVTYDLFAAEFFTDIEGQLHLLRSIAESKTNHSQQLFLDLSRNQSLQLAFSNLDAESFKQCLISKMHNVYGSGDELFSLFTALNEFLHIPAVQNRSEVRQALETKASDVINRYTLRDLVQNIDKIEILCDNDDAVACLYKGQIQQHLKRKGFTPVEVLKNLTWGGRLRINSKTTADIVTSVVDLFFHDLQGRDIYDVFVLLIKHVQFWEDIFTAEGTKSYLLRNDNLVRHVNSCLSKLSKLLLHDEVELSYLSKIEIQNESTKKLLRLAGMSDSNILALRERVNRFNKAMLEELSVVTNVLHAVQKKNVEAVSTKLETIQQCVKHVKEKFNKGSIYLKECSNLNSLWGDLEQLPELCLHLEPVVTSAAFWNVGLKPTLEAYSGSLDCITEFSTLMSIRLLFIEHDKKPDDELVWQELLDCEQAISFLKKLKNIGLNEYSGWWKRLEEDASTSIVDVMTLFEGASVADEIKIVQTYLKRPLEKNVKKTLLQLSKRTEVIEKANAMESVLKALGYNVENDTDMQKALISFQQLISEDLSQSTLQDVRISLDTIFALAETLTDDTVHIMVELGKATLLVDFLKEIAVEDLRNLIDAVEDISESHVQESTVSALIEVKRYLAPLLNASLANEKGSRWIFETLQKQTRSVEDSSKSLPGKVNECMLNLHNLKSLYDNVANRGQQTKEIIKSIIIKGKFVFTLQNEESKVTVDVQYKDNKNQYKKQEAAIIDLRSRALLLLNTDRHSKESSINPVEFQEFIGHVDICLEIRDILSELFSLGHIYYSSFCQKCLTQKLCELKTELRCKLDQWLLQLHQAREEYYLMNFIQGFQIHSIYEYLSSKSIGEEKVNTILQFIHPTLTAEQLANSYPKEKVTSDEFLMDCGRTLHKLYEGKKMFFRKMKDTEQAKTIRDTVQAGKLLVAHLEEQSEYVVRTILALYKNTTNCMPEPNQLLLCSDTTTWGELESLIQRCLRAQEFYGTMPLFCIANVELLQNELQFRLVDRLQQLKNRKNYLLAVVCCGTKNHLFFDQFFANTSSIQSMSENTVETIYQSHFKHVSSYTSEVASLGKTTAIQKKAAKKDRSIVTLHVSGIFKRSELIERLNELKIRQYHVLHIDIGSVDNVLQLDTFLFELVVMRYVSTNKVSFCLQTDHVCFEIANTVDNTLKNKLQTPSSFEREQLQWNDFTDFVPSEEIFSPVQVVCHYLQKLDNNQLDKEDIRFVGLNAVKPLPAHVCQNLLRKHLSFATDISFSVVHIFLNVLADQLKKFSCSVFFRVSRIPEMVGGSTVPNVRSSLVKAMVEVSKEFASRSVNACRAAQKATVAGQTDTVTLEKGFLNKLVERIDSMIRWEDSNHLIYVFHSQNIQTLSPMYRDRIKVPAHIKQLFESQIRRSLEDFSLFGQMQLQDMLQRVARSQPDRLNPAKLLEISKEYALTPDNLLKMVLISLRIQSNVPVVIMGETGCGKTSLIRYLANICEVPFRVLNIHAGITSRLVEETVMEEHYKCLEKSESQRWLFLDEINTSESIGYICDIICHHRCKGNLLSPKLVIMGACNPYKLRSVTAIQTAGLSGKVRTDELSKLVYRVLPLPEMMVDYVWDFGSLSESDEKKYISRMVEQVFPLNSLEHDLLRDLLSLSQSFVREKENSSCVVSLRDVQRCKLLIIWFCKILKQKNRKHIPVKQQNCDHKIRGIILGLGHCYHSRFVDKGVRCEYLQSLQGGFEKNKLPDITAKVIYDVIKEEQQDILDRMAIPQGTARNTALRENVFVILVCILNRIPIFVVGKPGCSKSLAMQVIRSNLRGKDSTDEFFKTLPQLYCVSFQGSESSTSDGILKVFERAEIYQKQNKKDSVLSVVILDEIGLAEISKFNPLKVLHNLLEPDGMSVPNVAVVGISNWALDASKMNRAIHLSRPDMDDLELFETATSISESFVENSYIQRGLSWTQNKEKLSVDNCKEELKLLAHAYAAYTRQLQFKNFHGLRDFYSLVKYISRIYAKDFQSLDPQMKSVAMIEGLFRNFGGLKTGRHDLLKHFSDCIPHKEYVPRCSVIDLIKNNISDEMARHLMIISKSESVMGILEQVLRDTKREKKEVIFGSQFEEDLTDDYNYRILSRIILCMEQGIVLVLKDLDNIYGSLYDMLNQNYTRIGKKNNCRIALGPYSNPFCHVAESFRCIVLVDESKLDYSDPPFLNRFEKQFVTFAGIMTEEEIQVKDQLLQWIKSVTTMNDRPFTTEDAFPYYNEELVVSLVKATTQNYGHEADILNICKRELLWIIRPEVVVRLPALKTALIDDDWEFFRQMYFELPVHEGLGHFVRHQMENTNHMDSDHQMTVIFTNSNIHTNIVEELSGLDYQTEKLGAFKSEKQLSLKLQQFWENKEKKVLLVQCNAADDDKHVMLTKTLIEKYAVECQVKVGEMPKYVFLVVHLQNRTSTGMVSEAFSVPLHSISQINYLCNWKLVLLDCLERPKLSLPQKCSRTLRDTIESLLPLTQILKEELFWAFTRMHYKSGGRDVDSVHQIMSYMNSEEEIWTVISGCIWSFIKENIRGEDNEEWCLRVACNLELLNTSAHFTDALDKQIRQVIKTPFAKIIYRLEVMGSLDSYFVDDQFQSERRALWLAALKDEALIGLEVVPEVTGPACFLCDTADLKLKMPFSFTLFEAVEKTKEVFMESVTRTKFKCDLENEDDLPIEVYEEILLQHESHLFTKVPDIFEVKTYVAMISDYTDDYCNLYSHSLVSNIPRERRIHYIKWAIGHKVDLNTSDFFTLVVHLHSVGWIHFSLLNSTFTLFDICRTTLNGDILEMFEHEIKESGSISHEELQADRVTEYESNPNEAEKCANENLQYQNKVGGTSTTISESNNLEELDLLGHAVEHLNENHTEELELTEIEIDMKGSEKVEPTLTSTLMQETVDSVDLSVVEDTTICEIIERTELDKNVHPTSLEVSDKIKEEHLEKSLEFSNSELTLNASPTKATVYDEFVNKHKIFRNDSDADVFSKLVTFVCQQMLSATVHVDDMFDLEKWNRSTRSILLVASEVSMDSTALYALRLCDDIVTDIFIPSGIDPQRLQNVAIALQSCAIDSEEVFKELLCILEEKCVKTVNIQRILSQYLFRCLTTDPETIAYRHFLRAIQESRIPREEMQLLKAPLQYLIQQNGEGLFLELIIDERELVTLLDSEQSLFLLDLDDCLKATATQSKRYTQFEVLIIDLIQASFQEDGIEENKGQLLLSAGKWLQNEQSGLRFALAVACIKTITLQAANFLSDQTPEMERFPLGDFNAALTGLEHCPALDFILEYFLKSLFDNLTLHQLVKLCNGLQTEMPVLQIIQWSDNLSADLEENLLSVQNFGSELGYTKQLVRRKQDSKSLEQSIFKLRDLANKNTEHRFVIILAVAMHEFYLPRSRRFLDLTDKIIADVFQQVFAADFTEEQKKLMQCLLGNRDFCVSELRHGEETSLQKVLMNSVILSAQICSVCITFEGTLEYPLLPMCLWKPQKLKDAYVPSVPDVSVSHSYSAASEKSSDLFLCPCGTRLAVKRLKNQNVSCAVCRKYLERNEQLQAPGRQPTRESPQQGILNLLLRIDFSHPVRQLSPVAANILQLLVKACLLGSLEIGVANVAFLAKFLSVSKDEVPQQLFFEILRHWQTLGQMLNLSDHDVAILIAVISANAEKMLFREGNSFQTFQQRECFESEFEKVVTETLSQRAQVIRETHLSHMERFKLSFNTVEARIRELDTKQDYCAEAMHLRSVFRLSRQPSKEDFICQLYPLRKRFPFLWNTVQQEEDLCLPTHIYNIVQWHLSIVAKISYQIKRHECLNLTVLAFFDSQKDAGQKAALKNSFKALQKSWIEMKTKFQGRDILNSVQEISFESKMSDCLILDENSELYKVLDYLVTIQNTFIDTSLEESFTCENLKFLQRDENVSCMKSLPTTRLKRDHVIEMKFDWNEKLVQESNARLQYGFGKQVEYDFQNIEKEQAVELLAHKVYINIQSMPRIIFADELYRNFVELVEEVKCSVKQESLPSDIEAFFLKKNEEYPHMSLELINYLDMIMTLLRNTKSDGEKPLKEFLADRTAILGICFPAEYLPQPEERLKLCHVISLHELLEEISAERVIGGWQYKYRLELEDTVKEYLTKSTSLRLQTAEIILKSVKHFVYRCLYMGDSNAEETLTHYLSHPSFWPESYYVDGKLCIDKTMEDLNDVIPPSILVGHVVELMKHLFDYIEKQREGEVRLDKVITSWKSKPELTSKVKQQRKVLKKLRKT